MRKFILLALIGFFCFTILGGLWCGNNTSDAYLETVFPGYANIDCGKYENVPNTWCISQGNTVHNHYIQAVTKRNGVSDCRVFHVEVYSSLSGNHKSYKIDEDSIQAGEWGTPGCPRDRQDEYLDDWNDTEQGTGRISPSLDDSNYGGAFTPMPLQP